MFDPAIFDTEIFDTPAPFHFGRAGRKFERKMYKPLEQNITITGAPIRMHQLTRQIQGIPFRRINTPIMAHGVAYRAFNKEVAINRKRGFKMLLEMLEGD